MHEASISNSQLMMLVKLSSSCFLAIATSIGGHHSGTVVPVLLIGV
jgi:hypothetical protein